MITVLLADDHTVVRQALKILLETKEDFKVVGEAENGRQAVALARKESPMVAVLDIAMPELNGIEATRMIRAANNRTRVVVLSALQDKGTIEKLLEAGATGYVLKINAFEELVTAIRAVDAGQTYLSPQIAALLVDAFLHDRGKNVPAVFHKLTPREREVLQLLAEGRSVKEVSALLSVSTTTVHTHRNHILEKLNLHSNADLVRFAIKEGISAL